MNDKEKLDKAIKQLEELEGFTSGLVHYLEVYVNGLEKDANNGKESLEIYKVEMGNIRKLISELK